MDYAELAKRLRAFNYGASEGANHHPKVCLEAADAIEALTSPPDEAKVDAGDWYALPLLDAFAAWLQVEVTESEGRLLQLAFKAGAAWGQHDALNAAHRIRVKKEAKA